MIYFLNSTYLWALPLVAIPLAIHLINLHRHKVIYFSQTTFLKKVEQESRKARKINNLMLLIIRMLAILFLVLAFAKPTFYSDPEIKRKDVSSVVIFIDNSLSMQAENSNGNLLSQAKQYAIKRISSWSPTTTVKVLSHSGIVAEKINPELVQSTVEKINYSATTLPPQTILQLSSISQQIGTTQLWVISDMQENYWNSFFAQIDTSLNIVPVKIDTDEPQNVTIDTVWFDNPYRNVEIEQHLNVRITNQAAKARSNIHMRLFVNDTLGAVQSIDLQEFETKVVTFKYTNQSKGWIIGRVDIEDYPIVFDNQYFFSYYVPEQRRVLMIGDTRYYQPLIRLYGLSKHIEHRITQPRFVTASMLDSVSTIILRLPEELSEAATNSLYNSVNSGKNLVLLIDTAVDFESEKRFLQLFDIEQPGKSSPVKATASSINLQHHVFKNAILEIDKETKMPVIKSIRRYKQRYPLANTLMATDLSDQVVVAKPADRGMVYMINVDMVGNSVFSQHPVFVPLFLNMVLFSASHDETVYTIEPNFCIEAPIEDKVSDAVPLFSNPEHDIDIIPRFQTAARTLKLCFNNQVHVAGIWQLKVAGSNIANIALNYSRFESIARYVQSNSIENNKLQFVSIDQPYDKNRSDTKFSLWQFCALLALFCFIAEMLMLSKIRNLSKSDK